MTMKMLIEQIENQTDEIMDNFVKYGDYEKTETELYKLHELIWCLEPIFDLIEKLKTKNDYLSKWIASMEIKHRNERFELTKEIKNLIKIKF